MAKTSAIRKSRTVANPLEAWQSADGEWEWRVLEKKSEIIWECAVKSPHTFGSWEYGDVYAQTVTANKRVFVDLGFGSGYFADLVPVAIASEINVPDPSEPQAILSPEICPFLCQYFVEDNMSFHCTDEQAEIIFFFSTSFNDCPTVLSSDWGIQYGEEELGQFHFDILIYDQPDDPLTIPFFYNTTDEKHRYEMSQLVEQETLSFFALAHHNKSLIFFDSRFLTLPEDLRRDLAPIVRESLLRASVAKET